MLMSYDKGGAALSTWAQSSGLPICRHSLMPRILWTRNLWRISNFLNNSAPPCAVLQSRLLGAAAAPECGVKSSGRRCLSLSARAGSKLIQWCWLCFYALHIMDLSQNIAQQSQVSLPEIYLLYSTRDRENKDGRQLRVARDTVMLTDAPDKCVPFLE